MIKTNRQREINIEKLIKLLDIHGGKDSFSLKKKVPELLLREKKGLK